MRRAVIDIGTNSVKLLVAEVKGGAVLPLFESSHQTRLGRGFYREQRLQKDAILDTVQAVASLAAAAADWSAESIRTIATSATREAKNQEELLEAVRAASGLAVHVLSGEEEANLAYAGVRTNPALASQSLLILDVGGGSTEFTLGQGPLQTFSRSFPLGTVRLLEEIQPADPPLPRDWQRCRDGLAEQLATHVQPVLRPFLAALSAESLLLVGTGGTFSILAAMETHATSFDRERFEQVQLTRERVREYRELLWRVPLNERQRIPGLPPNRADVILFGIAIVALIMDTFEIDLLRVSTRGLRFGALACQ